MQRKDAWKVFPDDKDGMQRGAHLCLIRCDLIDQDYLLTESELKDRERLPIWEKPNPHKETWSNMYLFLRCQVEAFAWSKWGSPEALDKEFERREQEKKDKKEKKYKEKMKGWFLLVFINSKLR